MRKWISILAVVLAATPALADKKLDDAVAKAESLAEKGKPEEGIKAVQKVADGSNSAEAYVALGRIQNRFASPEDAQTSFAKAVELSAAATPDVKAEALAALSGQDLLRGTGRDALTHAEEAVKAAPANVNAHAALARAQARVKDGVTALATADKAVQAGPTSGMAHLARGEALLASSRAKEAEAEFRKALEVDPKLHLARTKLAWALLAAGDAAGAEAEAKKASDADQKSGEAFAVLGRAILARDPKRWDDAIAQAQQGAFLNPRDPLVQMAVGQIFEAGNNIDQANLAYGRALAADPGFTPARVANVGVLIRKGQTDAALADAQKIVQEMPNNAQAQLQLGRLYLRKGDWQNAYTALDQSVKLAPGDAEAQARLGTAAQYVGKKPEALAAYKKAVELDPKNVDYRTTYGLILGVNGQANAGVEELKKVVATPGYADSAGYVNLGWLYRNTEPKQPEASVAAYKKGLELNPKEEQAALGMGWSYINMKNWDAAIAAFNQAVQIDPTTAPEANNAIGWSYLFKKDADKAQEYYDKGSASGRADARLKTNIERLRKNEAIEEAKLEAPPPPPPVAKPDVGSLSSILMSGGGSPSVRRKAARDLAGLGPEGVPALINAVRNDQDWDVREQAANSLGSIGPKASAAIPHLMHILNSPRVMDKTVMDKAEMAASMREEDFRKAVRNALLKIQGK
ncbi:MAG TPA: tetratricopeptide repeat protein [Vicinamibacteria bacterium]|nr:tetratricopeptide repeat protein [Vicinamibacteria bacterium]